MNENIQVTLMYLFLKLIGYNAYATLRGGYEFFFYVLYIM